MILPDICTNVAECAKLSKEKAAITEELEGLYENGKNLHNAGFFPFSQFITLQVSPLQCDPA